MATGITKKLGEKFKAAFNATKGKPTTITDNGNLPPGIEDGVAQLTEVKFDTYKKGKMQGEYYFIASGVVVEPEYIERDGRKIKVRGKRTQIMEPLANTPSRTRVSLEDHLDWVQNELRKLGVPTAELSPDDLEPSMEALKKQKPYFTFRTWQGTPTKEFPNPNVNHTWNGLTEYVEGDQQQEPDNEPEPEPEAPAPAPEPAKPAGKRGKAAKKQEELPTDPHELAKLANEQNQEAQEKLEAMALESGVMNADEVAAAPDWVDVADAIVAGAGDDEPVELVDDPEPEIEVGSKVEFTGKDKKTVTGEVMEITGDKVKVKAGKTAYIVALDKVTLVG